MKWFLALAAAFALGFVGCGTPPGGPEYADLGLRALDASGAEQSRDCVPLPVLPGAVVEKDVTLAPGLSAHVRTEPDFAEVALSDANDPAASHVTIPKATLRNGYSKTLTVTTAAGATYTVILLSPCVPADAGTD
jgi:hypothetical protein